MKAARESVWLSRAADVKPMPAALLVIFFTSHNLYVILNGEICLA
jgi:hypothetical protein